MGGKRRFFQASPGKRCIRENRMKSYFAAFCICVLILAGPGLTRAQHARQGLQEKSLTIGLVPEQNLFKQIERYTALADYLSSKTGVKIKLKTITRYGNVVDSFVSSGLDGAFLGSLTYVLVRAKMGVEVLARPENAQGVSTYHGLIFVRHDSGIKNVNGMRGKRFVFVDQASTAGFLLPLDYLRSHGVENYRSYLKEVYFAGTHEDPIYDVLNKKADIGAAKNTVFDRLAESDRRIKEELLVLAKSPEVPENGLALRKDIDGSVRSSLTEALLNMHRDAAGQIALKNFGAVRFIVTTDKDYEPVVRYAYKVGLNIDQYHSWNDR